MRYQIGLLITIAIALTTSDPVFAETWTGAAGNHDWNTAGNWNPATVPNSAAATAAFYPAAGGTVNISASIQVASLSFSSVGSYTLTSSAGQTLSGVKSITVSSASAAQQIDLSFVSTGSLLFPTGSSLTIDNSETLLIGPNTVIGTTGTGGVVASGSGTTQINGSFFHLSGGLTENGPGMTVLRGDGTNLGGLTVNAGVLRLDYSANPATKLGSGSLALNGGGTLSLVANSGTAVTQVIPGGTKFGAGQANVSASGTGTLTLAAGTITRVAGATFDFAPPANGPVFAITTSTGNTNGLLGAGSAWSTFGGGLTWATAVNGSIGGLNGGVYGVDTFAAGTNVDVVSSASLTSFTANSLRFGGGGNPNLTLAGTNMLQSGGILVTPGAGGGMITGGSLTVSGGGELIVHQYGSSPLVINSALVQTGGLTKTGPGALFLQNAVYNGPTQVTGGLVRLGSGSVLPANQNVSIARGATLEYGGLSNGASSAIKALTISNGTFATKVVGGDLYLNKLTMTNGVVDFGGSIGFALHFAGTGAAATINPGISAWSGSDSRIVNDTTAPLTVNLAYITNTSSVTFPFDAILTVGAILSNGGANQGFQFVPDTTTSGFNGVVRLTNTHNTANITAVVTGLVSSDLSTDVGAGAFGTLGTGTIVISSGYLTYDGPTATCAKPLTLLGTAQISLGSGDSHHVGSLTLAGPLTGSGGAWFGYAGFVDSSTTTLTLTGTNTYSGQTQADCRLQIGNGGTTGTLGTGNLIDTRAVTFNRSDDISFAGNVSGPGTLTKAGSNTLTIGGTYTLTGATTIAGGTLALNSPANYTLSGTINGAGTLAKGGGGTLTLTGVNTYAGGTTILDGTLSVAADGALGTGPVAIASAFGSLSYTGTTTTARSFSLGGGTLAVAAGKTLTLNGGAVTDGYLGGSGSFATSAASGARFGNTTSLPSVTIASSSPTDRYVNFGNGGILNVAAALAGPISMTGLTNEGSGMISIGGGSQVNAANFQSYGTLTLLPGTSFATRSQFVNTGAAPLGFGAGSRTFIATPATAGSNLASVDLNGQDAIVTGGLFVNNGLVTDNSASGGPSRLIADYGALIKGGGMYAVSVVTQNGGRFQAGNSPGRAMHGSLTFGPGGLRNDTFQVNNAAGVAGPTAGANELVSGWTMHEVATQIGLISTSGAFTWTADSMNKETVTLQTLLDPTPVGSDNFGIAADFDPSQSYAWPFVRWTGTYSGPASDADLTGSTTFDTTGFANPTDGGTFAWHLDVPGRTLSLTFTAAVPEPGTLALVATVVAAAGWSRYGSGRCRRRA